MLRSTILSLILFLPVVSHAVPDGDIAPLNNRDYTVTIADALVALRYALGLNGQVTAEVLDRIDVAPFLASGCNWPRRDNQATIADALVILRIALNLTSIAAPNSCGYAPGMTAPVDIILVENIAFLLTPQASDEDGPLDAIDYQFSGPDGALLTFDGSNIRFLNAPDFDNSPCNTPNSCQVTITPTDGSNQGQSHVLNITITDLNDTAPVMTSADSANVPENSTAVIDLTASDADSTGEATVFSLGGTDAALFQLDGDSLRFINAPDFDNPPCNQGNSCVLEVTPSDGSNTGQPQALSIQITDLNDSAPVITSAAELDVPENSALVPIAVSDVDTTGEPLILVLSGADAPLFQFDGSNLRFVNAPDFESPPCDKDDRCIIAVTPSDGSNTGVSQTLTVRITDVNDNAPQVDSDDSAEVVENTTAVIQLAAVDVDTTGEVARFSLGGTDAALFQIIGNSLSFIAAPDFENPPCAQGNSCSIGIIPDDGLNTGPAQVFIVTITDVNDNAPQMSSADTAQVAENSTAVLELTVNDPDTTGEDPNFSLGGTDAGLFEIDGNSLRFVAAPDFENPPCAQGLVCTVDITPDDGSYSGNTQTVTVTIIDANDIAPVLSMPGIARVPENSTLLFGLGASDADTTGEATIYNLSGTDAPLFQVIGDNLHFINAPDFESPSCNQGNSCVLEVTPSDGVNSGQLQSVAVTITDLPTLAFNQGTASVAEADGSISVQVDLSAFINNSAVDFATSAGTATAGSDYTATSGSVNFTGGAIQGAATVSILSDDYVEPDETFRITLSNPVNAELGSPVLMTITITDSNAAALNDTGISACGNASANDMNCPQSDYPGQDAEYGRDVTHNDDSDGHAGFSYTKRDADGNPLADQSVAYATQPWSCVKDNVTGLIWEVKTSDGGLRNNVNTYTWYNPADTENGGSAGTANGGSCSGGIDCDTQSYKNEVNRLGLCGAADWRVPGSHELSSLVDSSIAYPGPTLDTAYFVNTPVENSSPFNRYWSASPYAGYSDGAWYVDFRNGRVYDSSKRSTFHVRLVRGGQ